MRILAEDLLLLLLLLLLKAKAHFIFHISYFTFPLVH